MSQVSALKRGLRRLRGNLPLLVTVLVHAVAIILAAVWVVSETIVGAKRRFEPPPPSAAPETRRQVEHRVQVARRSSAAGAAAPVSVDRIRSTSAAALVLPELPALPAAGLGGFGGLGAGGGMGLGTGSGMATSLGGGLGGRSLMSMSFLGLAQVEVERVVFVVDVGRSLMDIRKGGFRAFEIIRNEITRLVTRLPPGGEFGVVLFDDNLVNRFEAELVPATVTRKEAFLAWIAPVNTDASRLGAGSAGTVVRWAAADSAGASGYRPSRWLQALEAAVELRPETIFLITGTAGTGTVELDAAGREQRAQAQRQTVAALARQGLDPAAVNAARQAALAQAQAELRRINEQLAAQGRDPFVVRSSRRLLDEDFQAAIRRAGFRLDVDTSGWRDSDGRPIWEAFVRTQTVERASEEVMQQHVVALQRAAGRTPAQLHIFLFTGLREESATDGEMLERTARRHGGRFSLLTSRQLEQVAASR